MRVEIAPSLHFKTFFFVLGPIWEVFRSARALELGSDLDVGFAVDFWSLWAPYVRSKNGVSYCK